MQLYGLSVMFSENSRWLDDYNSDVNNAMQAGCTECEPLSDEYFERWIQYLQKIKFLPAIK